MTVSEYLLPNYEPNVELWPLEWAQDWKMVLCSH